MGAEFVIAVDISAVPEGNATGDAARMLLQTFAIMGRTHQDLRAEGRRPGAAARAWPASRAPTSRRAGSRSAPAARSRSRTSAELRGRWPRRAGSERRLCGASKKRPGRIRAFFARRSARRRSVRSLRRRASTSSRLASRGRRSTTSPGSSRRRLRRLACEAFCTLSNALLAAATADFTRATAFSVPAGAFLTAVSTTDMNLACASGGGRFGDTVDFGAGRGGDLVHVAAVGGGLLGGRLHQAGLQGDQLLRVLDRQGGLAWFRRLRSSRSWRLACSARSASRRLRRRGRSGRRGFRRWTCGRS